MAGANTLEACLKAHFARLKKGDYAALLAFIERNADNAKELDAIRATIRDATGAASCLGFGPRFLHSTGQAYKGGPDTGVFLQITCDHARDVAVPGRGYSFGAVIDAQAAGDLAGTAGRLMSFGIFEQLQGGAQIDRAAAWRRQTLAERRSDRRSERRFAGRRGGQQHMRESRVDA